jgi:endonuclease G
MNRYYQTVLLIVTVFLFQCSLPKSATEKESITSPSYASTLEVLNHEFFEVGYDLSKRHAAYVRYMLTPSDLQGKAKRKNNFKPDPLLPEQFSAQDEDYYKSGFDRGHLCPAADMKTSQSSMDKSFYYSNMSPQLPGFNRGIWKKLEAQVREWTKHADSLWINTGPIFHTSDTTLDASKIAVPQKYYKTILRYEGNEKSGIGFILNNASSKNELISFIVSIDKVETATQLDFHQFLPNTIEEEIESKIDTTIWFN